jgi:hypothetical protein
MDKVQKHNNSVRIVKCRVGDSNALYHLLVPSLSSHHSTLQVCRLTVLTDLQSRVMKCRKPSCLRCDVTPCSLVDTYRRHAGTFIMDMRAEGDSEKLVPGYQTRRCHTHKTKVNTSTRTSNLINYLTQSA